MPLLDLDEWMDGAEEEKKKIAREKFDGPRSVESGTSGFG